MDLNDEKDNIPDLQRDKQIYMERLNRAVHKKEIAQDMHREAEAEMYLSKAELDRIEYKIREMEKKKVSSGGSGKKSIDYL